ncbi:MAG TPA: SDR family oxidoreductase [Tepidisphaeraceae bacterium]|jgi:NAD(P)-dependent dehydrogenase (short-subunit alcohol dehydrogenase family)|nr:SDR family oxidoreductase [Tepidisphaeraceae bacterium]
MQKPVAIITGAGRGIGRAAAGELARRHYQLVLLARSVDELEETKKLCGGGLVLPVDVTDAAAVDRVIQTAFAEFGAIDAIVHCAGIAPVKSIADMSVAEWHAVIDTNLSAAFYLCKSAWPIFAKQGSGVVVNVSSVSARDPFAGFSAYGASKAGLNLFGLSAAREGSKIGVRVHTIAPGAVETGMFRKILTPEQYPAEKTLRPADVAQTIAQCVTGELRFTSGEVIYLQRDIGDN